jgi:uncharacterized protein
MNSEDNKQIVLDYRAHFRNADVAKLTGAMSEDATWWILGKPHMFLGAGTKSKAEMERIWGSLFGRMKDSLDMAVIGLVAEGDKVADEVRSHADLTDGRIYENQYHLLFTLR